MLRFFSITLCALALVITARADKSYKVFIDGRFIYFAPLEKSNVIECRLRQSAVARTGKSHNLKITVTDNCHNTATYSARFIW